MSNLNLDLDYFEHPKIRRLVGLLGRGAEVLPIRLWCYCGKYHVESGKLTGYSVQEIESVATWWGRSGEMVAAMMQVGLLDEEAGSYAIHDWMSTNGHLIAFKKRATDAANVRWGVSNATSSAKRQRKQSPNQPTVPTKPTVPTIPEPLASLAGFPEVWGEWEQYKREIKKPLTDTVRKKQWRLLARQPDPVAVVNQSIERQWVGLFELRENRNAGNDSGRNQGRSGKPEILPGSIARVASAAELLVARKTGGARGDST